MSYTQTTIDDLLKIVFAEVKTDISKALYFSLESAIAWVKELSSDDDEEDDECPYDDQYIVKGLIDAVSQIEAWLAAKPEGWIVEYCEEWSESRSKSWERCNGEWRGSPGQLEGNNCAAFMQLFSKDSFCYLLACEAVGAGVGFWEIFGDFPQVNTIV